MRPLRLILGCVLWLAAIGNADVRGQTSSGDNTDPLPPLLVPNPAAHHQPQEEQASPYDSPSNSLSIGSFPGQLLANFKGLFSTHNLIPLVVGSAATGVAAVLDDDIRDHLSSTRRARVLGEVGNFLANPVTIGAVSGGLWLSSYLTQNEKFQAMGFSLAQGYVVNTTMTQAMKTATQRERPNGEGSRSFPSGHASDSFMLATVISHYYPKAWIPAYVTASLIGVSRLEKNKHYLSDILAGATLGYLVGRTVVGNTDALRRAPQVTWMPFVSGEGDRGLSVLVRF